MASAPVSIEAVSRFQLDQLLASVPAGTSSRKLIATPDFRQVLFCMDAAQEISEHRSPFLAIVQVLAGGLRIAVGGNEYRLDAGDWLSMPPDAPHALRADTPARFLLTMVRQRVCCGGSHAPVKPSE
ncbi:MAG: cupin domain-containing protein [Phycisphaerae bacterium]